jgi:hypothetical protein
LPPQGFRTFNVATRIPLVQKKYLYRRFDRLTSPSSSVITGETIIEKKPLAWELTVRKDHCKANIE